MKSIFIVAGGTGGHINAALSMGDSFKEDYNVIYFTGKRYLDYQLFKKENVVHLNAKPLRSKNILSLLKNILINISVFIKIISIVIRERPAFMIGAGGYVCGPVLLCGKLLFRRIFIIEQNSIVGLTNRLLAKIANLVFTSFEKTKGLDTIAPEKILNLGNPIRSNISYQKNLIGDKPRILVFGGSLGAQQINTSIEALVKEDKLSEFEVLHQVGKNNIRPELKEGILYRQQEYIDNMNEAYRWANIIIARSGASTVSELRVIAKPTILVPFPNATDNHQYYNALELKKENRFHVEVLDQTKKGDELANSILKALRKINDNSLYVSDESETIKSAEKIKKEIERYVRN